MCRFLNEPERDLFASAIANPQDMSTALALGIGPHHQHRKSKTGCLSCNKRRVKCDERHPICRNCAIGNRHCEYAPASQSLKRINGSSGAASSIHNVLPQTDPNSLTAASLSAVTNDGNTRGDSGQSALVAVAALTAIHIQIFYHATSTIADQMAIEDDGSSMTKVALDNASTEPYVLDQMLALSALHYSATVGSSSQMYAQEATELQTRALSRFNDARDRQGPNTGICSLLFVSPLGIHPRHGTVAVHSDNIGDFVSSFVGYMRIHRGVRVVAKVHWQEIRQSGLDPLFHLTKRNGDSRVSHSGEETAELRALLESSPDSSTICIQACLEALSWALWAINLKATVPEMSSKGVHATKAWPLMVCEEYVECLHQRRPEALAVLAFFAASLHQRPGFWGFGSSGPRLAQSIVTHVGPYWADSLTWPR